MGAVMANKFIKTESRNGVLILTMHDPATRNAMGTEMAQEVIEALNIFETNPEERVLLLTGTEPSFCSGANVRGFSRRIQERERQTQEAKASRILPWGGMEARFTHRPEQSSEVQPSQVPLRIHELQKPSIAAVNGHAMGVGMGIALACDIRVAAEKAEFSEAFIRMGLIPGDGSCWQLPRLIGLSNTLMLQYTGDRIGGTEAYRMGLVSKVVSDDLLPIASLELATRLAQGPTQALSLIKYLVHRGLESNFRESLEVAHVAQEQARQSDDHREAVQAFLEKRRPHFKSS
jgi:2-(1,2-epoxy-1,2-dihydrophenyl)acetyl-CoA isomerase